MEDDFHIYVANAGWSENAMRQFSEARMANRDVSFQTEKPCRRADDWPLDLDDL